MQASMISDTRYEQRSEKKKLHSMQLIEGRKSIENPLLPLIHNPPPPPITPKIQKNSSRQNILVLSYRIHINSFLEFFLVLAQERYNLCAINFLYSTLRNLVINEKMKPQMNSKFYPLNKRILRSHSRCIPSLPPCSMFPSPWSCIIVYRRCSLRT